MITCPVCHQQEYDGELLCSRCGARLPLSEETTASWEFPAKPVINTKPALPALPLQPAPPAPPPSRPLAAPEPGQLVLAPEGASDPVVLAGKTEFILGRESQAQTPPDVDLNPFGGREKGVSRRHASLRVNGKQTLLMDLGSANGTRLNGEPLRPNEPVRLLDGDEIRLGRLSLHVFFNL